MKQTRMKYVVTIPEIVLLVVTLALFTSIYPITVPWKPVFASPDTAEDYVDIQSDVDSVADKGTHSNFENQKATDSTYDTMTEANTNTTKINNTENFVDNNSSNVDSHTGHGTHSSFPAMQAGPDSTFDTLTEANTAGTAGFSYKQGTFTANIVTGNQIVDTGSGVVIKALILYGSWQTVEGFEAGESGFLSYIASATQRKCIAWASDDNVATTNTGCGSADAAVLIFSGGTPTQDGLADFVSFGTGADAGKFTINWSDAPSIAFIIHYVALGGDDLTNVFVGEYAATKTTGSQAYTGVGFQGDVILFSGISKVSPLGTMANMLCWMGAAQSSTARGSIFWGAEDAQTKTGKTKHWQDTTNCVSMPKKPLGIDAKADFVSFDADGFTLNWTDAAGSVWVFFVMVLKGGSYNVNTFTAPASIGAQSITTGFQPAGVLFFGTGQTTADATLGLESHVCLGAMGESPPEEGSIWTSADDTISSDSNKRSVTTKCVQVNTNPSTITAEADATSLDSNGFTITWTTTSSGRRFFSVAFGYSINYELDFEFQWTTADFSQTSEYLCIYTGTVNAEALKVDVRNGGSWTNIIASLSASQWNNVSIGTYLTNSTITFRFLGGTETGDTSQSSWQIDCAIIHVWSVGINYELELEEQFTNASYTRTNEELCIKTGTFNAGGETLSVQWWNATSSSWVTIIASLSASQWNNVSVTAYLTSSTFTIRFIDGTKVNDNSQGTWQKDSCLLHTWTLGYNLNLRVMDLDLTDPIQGAYVYKDSDVKISDVNGWANWTLVSGVVTVQVKYFGFLVNETSINVDSDKTIDVRCNLFDVTVNVKENVRNAKLSNVNVTVYNGTSVGGNKIKSGISNNNGQVTLTNLPNNTLTFTEYGGSIYTLVIGNATQLIGSDDYAFTIVCNQNYVGTTSNYSILVWVGGIMIPLEGSFVTKRLKRKMYKKRKKPK